MPRVFGPHADPSEHPGERRLSGLQAPVEEEVLPRASWTSELRLWLALAVRERRPDGGDVNQRPPGRAVRTFHLWLASPQPAALDTGDQCLAVIRDLQVGGPEHPPIAGFSSTCGSGHWGPVPCCERPSGALQDIQWQPWPLLTRCQWPPVGTTRNVCRGCKTSPVENHGPE